MMTAEHDVKHEDLQEITDAAILNVAFTCHEANKAYCMSIGDNSQKHWEQAPEWQKESAMKGVRMHMNFPNAGPQDSHESWYREKAEAGWKYGPTKDPEAKLHPCMVAFDELPIEQQMKDYIFCGIAKSMIRLLRKAGAIPQVTTRGMRQMNVQFNPDKNKAVGTIKQMCAELWDEMSFQANMKNSQLHNRLQEEMKKAGDVVAALTTSDSSAGLVSEAIGEAGRNMAMAKSFLETAQMHAVKSLTR